MKNKFMLGVVCALLLGVSLFANNDKVLVDEDNIHIEKIGDYTYFITTEFDLRCIKVNKKLSCQEMKYSVNGLPLDWKNANQLLFSNDLLILVNTYTK